MGDRAVSSACDNFVVDYEHGADGDFFAFGRLAGFLKGLGHEDMIGFGNFRHRAKNSTERFGFECWMRTAMFCPHETRGIR